MRPILIGLCCLVLLAGCETPATNRGPESISRFVYGFDPGDVTCAPGGLVPGGRFCRFTKEGRRLAAEISIREELLAPGDIPARPDRTFWQGVVEMMERDAMATSAGVPDTVVLRAELQGPPRTPVPAAEACVRYRIDRRVQNVFIDNEGVRCLFFDPESRVLDMVVLEYIEGRDAPPRNQAFSREADALIATLRQAPKPASR